ncbi:o-succinylbenzoate synthase [Algoriphagus halophilus]|uniref:O-succinylbenzoate synthase n=1 Tax=Algoriphagus halophilus TaxID=226505 RepID=A0A1N6EG09_9BACT|nr:o-succinylbenzoate synthase [Algoriphagus halophilus]SIN81827.1 o-succinylbenzoate synthase [Algoriphagus halophilus]
MQTIPTIRFEFIKRNLIFRFDAGTSRGVLKTKEVFWIKAFRESEPDLIGWGEAAPLVKLSPDDRPDFEQVLEKTLRDLEKESWSMEEASILEKVANLIPFELPSIRFGVETALLDLLNGGNQKIVSNPFYEKGLPIPINGLIWMGSAEFMKQQIDEKLAQGFHCIKMKIGAIDFEKELELLHYIRSNYSASEISLRVDANGAFAPEEALSKLAALHQLDLHSIEQPIRSGQGEEMKKLCMASELPIALDEELIGVKDKAGLLDQINPPYIILKPSLLGGIKETRAWISEAEKRGIGWWMTSALESNIGLNSISQLTSQYQPSIPQGLGTGKLFHNNLNSPLTVREGNIYYEVEVPWELPS